MSQNYSPFGYKYENGACVIKIRLHPNKFKQAGITHLGRHTVTKSGYIIFEAQLDLKGDAFKEFNERMKQPTQ